MFRSRTTRLRRARLVPIALTTAALSSAVLGASVTGTLSAFTASIQNTTNTATTGSLVMKETNASGSVTCLSSSGSNNSFASCGTINKYGGTSSAFTPGTTRTTSVVIANDGTSSVDTFKLQPGACTKTDLSGTSNSGDLCAALQLTLTCQKPSAGVITLYTSRTLRSIENDQLVIPASCTPGVSGAEPVTFSFALTLPTSADSSVQSQQVSQPLTWTFTGA